MTMTGKSFRWYHFLLLTLGILGMVLAPWVFTRKTPFGWTMFDFTQTGQIGDTKGGVTAPIVGLISILLLVWTLLKQIEFNDKQLRTQNEEQFKAAFFQMLQTQRELLHEVQGRFLSRNMKGNIEGGKVAGIDYFRDGGMELESLFIVLEGGKQLGDMAIFNLKVRYDIKDGTISKYKEACNEGKKMKIAYDIFFAQHPEMGNYFRHLYHILKFISTEKENALKDEIDEKEKKAIEKWYKSYADLLQATLSVEELRMAYYNCSSFDNAKKLFKEFQFVENLTKKNLIRPDKDVMEGFTIKEAY